MTGRDIQNRKEACGPWLHECKTSRQTDKDRQTLRQTDKDRLTKTDTQSYQWWSCWVKRPGPMWHHSIAVHNDLFHFCPNWVRKSLCELCKHLHTQSHSGRKESQAKLNSNNSSNAWLKQKLLLIKCRKTCNVYKQFEKLRGVEALGCSRHVVYVSLTPAEWGQPHWPGVQQLWGLSHEDLNPHWAGSYMDPCLCLIQLLAWLLWL